jgi:heme/copper-type cytochrome/quinol oxidase subunit 1
MVVRSAACPGFLSAVNHKQIGLRFIWTGVAFLLIGGIEGLLMRIQLSRAENTFLGPEPTTRSSRCTARR